MNKSLVAVSLVCSALMVATAQAEPAAAVKEGKQVVRPPQAKENTALVARGKRSEAKKRAAELRKKQQETAAGTEGK